MYIPETCFPKSYHDLLPAIHDNEVIDIVKEPFRPKDWVEEIVSTKETVSGFYEGNQLQKYW